MQSSLFHVLLTVTCRVVSVVTHLGLVQGLLGNVQQELFGLGHTIFFFNQLNWKVNEKRHSVWIPLNSTQGLGFLGT